MQVQTICRNLFTKTPLTHYFKRSLTTKAKVLSNAKESLNVSTKEKQQPDPFVDQTEDASQTAQDPLKQHDYFGVRNLVNIKELFDARVHLGHKIGTRNEYMKPYIYGTRLDIDVIDLEQTKDLLGDALNITAHMAYRKGVILFISRHLETIPLVEKTAIEAGEYAHCRFWVKGSFPNSEMVYGHMTPMPDMCIFLSTHDSVFKQHEAITECAKMNILTTGIVDTSCDPRLVTYPVPGNDDSLTSIKLYCRLFKEAIHLGKLKRREDDKDAEVIVDT